MTVFLNSSPNKGEKLERTTNSDKPIGPEFSSSYILEKHNSNNVFILFLVSFVLARSSLSLLRIYIITIVALFLGPDGYKLTTSNVTCFLSV